MMTTHDHDLLRIIDRARIELVYTRSSLRQFIHENEPLSSDVGVLMSRCNDAVKEADALHTKLSKRIDEQIRPHLVD